MSNARLQVSPGPEALQAVCAALLATFVVWNKLPEADPLTTTLRIAPAVAALLILCADWIERAGGRRLRRGPSLLEGTALTAFLLLVIARPGWLFEGTRGLDRFLVAGAALLLVHRLIRTTIAARPLLDLLSTRPHPTFFVLPAVFFLALLPWQSGARLPDGDEPYYLLITHSLSYDGDLDLGNNYQDDSDLTVAGRELAPQPGDPVGVEGELYSRHNLLLPLFLTPAYRLFGVAGALGMMCLLAAAAAWGFLAVGRTYFPDSTGPLLLAYLVLIVSSPLVVYSYQVWVEVPAAILLLAGLATVHSMTTRGSTRKNGLALVAVLVALPLLKARFLLFSGSLLMLAVVRSRSRRRLLSIACVLLAVVAIVLMVNTALFDNPLKYHDAGALFASLLDPAAHARGFFGLFFDCAFGLFAAAPIWLLMVPGLAAIGRSHRALATDIAFLTVPYLFLIAPRLEWYGGWGPPFRYAIALLPILALTLVPPLRYRNRSAPAAALVSLTLFSILTTLIAVVEPGTTYSFADGRSIALDRLTRISGLDITRFFPSYIRIRPATWLWPAATIAILLAVWHRPRRRRHPSALMAGAVVALALAATLVQLAISRPTKRIEFEDPYVTHAGGQLYPDRWRPARAAFRGGWILHKGDAVSAYPIPGGDTVAISLELKTQRPAAGTTSVLFEQGDRNLCRIDIEGTSSWTRLACKSAPWHRSGAPLTLRIEPTPGNSNKHPRVIVDRALLFWDGD